MEFTNIKLIRVFQSTHADKPNPPEPILIAWGAGCNASPYTYKGGINHWIPAKDAKSTVSCPGRDDIYVKESLDEIQEIILAAEAETHKRILQAQVAPQEP